jgi:hypothetical protein
MAAKAFDPYETLGISRNATDTEIRAAYRDLVARYHPDKHAGNPLEGLAAEKMAEINRAYEILSDSKRRAAYDRGDTGVRGAPGAAPASGNRLLKIIGFVLLVPLLIRFGRGLISLIVALIQVGWRSLQGLRGTPVALGLVLILVVFFVALLVRRRRAKKRRG